MSRDDGRDFELVLAVLGYWDQPRSGIAEYQQIPHRFSCEFDDERDDFPEPYLLRPISAEALRLECEAAEIDLGHPLSPELPQVLPDPIPRFPTAKPRYDEIIAALADDRDLSSNHLVRATAEFRRRVAPDDWQGRDLWEVRWTVVQSDS